MPTQAVHKAVSKRVYTVLFNCTQKATFRAISQIKRQKNIIIQIVKSKQLDLDPCQSKSQIHDPDCEQVQLLKDPPRRNYPQEWHNIYPVYPVKMRWHSQFFVTYQRLRPLSSTYPRFLWITVCNIMHKPLDNYFEVKPGQDHCSIKQTKPFKIITMS